jgi:protocatechuate 3,4-dioxygenase beta subunit
LAGHAIYLWHCDALGRYSIYDLPNASYLRAVGVTDSVGNAAFMTIFPGCYPGRYPHIHFEVYMGLEQATSYKNRLLTSQMAMPADACRAIYAASKHYGASAANSPRSASSAMRSSLTARQGRSRHRRRW